MPVVRFRDGSLVVPTRVTTSDGSVGAGVKRIDRRHPLYDPWRSYCERHPEDVVERRARFGETGEDLMDGLAMALAGFVLFLVLGAVDAGKGLIDGEDVGATVALGVLWVCGWFIAGVVSSRRLRDTARNGRPARGLEVEVEQPPGSSWLNR